MTIELYWLDFSRVLLCHCSTLLIGIAKRPAVSNYSLRKVIEFLGELVPMILIAETELLNSLAATQLAHFAPHSENLIHLAGVIGPKIPEWRRYPYLSPAVNYSFAPLSYRDMIYFLGADVPSADANS